MRNHPFSSRPKGLRATTRIYLARLVQLQYQIEKAKGSGLTMRDCLMLILQERGFKVTQNKAGAR